MKKCLIKIASLTVLIVMAFCSGIVAQKNDTIDTDKYEINKAAEKSLYARAIKDYLDAVFQKDKTIMDTLFIIKREYDQPDDFPDFELPQSISETKLLLLTMQQVDNHKELYCQSSPCINLMGWIEKDKAEFIFVTFYPGYKHQYDCYINYRFDKAKKEYNLEKLTIEVLIYDKNGNPDHFALYQDWKHIGDKPVK